MYITKFLRCFAGFSLTAFCVFAVLKIENLSKLGRPNVTRGVCASQQKHLYRAQRAPNRIWLQALPFISPETPKKIISPERRHSPSGNKPNAIYRQSPDIAMSRLRNGAPYVQEFIFFCVFLTIFTVCNDLLSFFSGVGGSFHLYFSSAFSGSYFVFTTILCFSYFSFFSIFNTCLHFSYTLFIAYIKNIFLYPSHNFHIHEQHFFQTYVLISIFSYTVYILGIHIKHFYMHLILLNT